MSTEHAISLQLKPRFGLMRVYALLGILDRDNQRSKPNTGITSSPGMMSSDSAQRGDSSSSSQVHIKYGILSVLCSQFVLVRRCHLMG